jgi:double zinc ribbon protein
MRCRSCHHDNRSGRRFCTQCGTTFAMGCPPCGAPIEVGEKFCGGCGAALTVGGPATISSPAHVPLLAEKIRKARSLAPPRRGLRWREVVQHEPRSDARAISKRGWPVRSCIHRASGRFHTKLWPLWSVRFVPLGACGRRGAGALSFAFWRAPMLHTCSLAGLPRTKR